MTALTIGSAVYDDYSGIELTYISLCLNQDLADCEIIVVDNNPDSDDGRRVKDFVTSLSHRFKARYVAMPSPVGTSAPRDRVFDEATGDAVLCMDSHVVLAKDAIARLKRYYAENRDNADINSGPMLNNSLQIYGTHFSDYWRSQMWGIWGQAWICSCSKWHFDISPVDPANKYSDGVIIVGQKLPPECQYHELAMGWKVVEECPVCGKKLPCLSYVGHEPKLEALGFKRRCWDPNDQEPFEIPGQGLGLFSCRKDAWLHFNKHAIGFGGEEMYIHEKFRRAGHRALCHPWLRWWHRFHRPGGVSYPIPAFSKIRNYVLEFQEMGWDTKPILDHFLPLKKITKEQWYALVADPINTNALHQIKPTSLSDLPASRPQPPDNATIDEVFDWAVSTPRDLDQHLPKIRELASKCKHITAFVKRREWDVAFVASGCERVISYQSEYDKLTATLHSLIKTTTVGRRTEAFSTTREDSTAVGRIERTDMLVLDTVHSADRVSAELEKFAPSVNRWILIRGTGAFGEVREGGGGPGLLPGIRAFMKKNTEWHRVYQSDVQYGLTLLSRDQNERTIDRGPGTELHGLLEVLGISATDSCSCRTKSRQMDQWGVSGCNAHFDEIVEWMRSGQDRFGWRDKLTAASKAVTSGIAFKINWLDPFPGLVREAISRADIKNREWDKSHATI